MRFSIKAFAAPLILLAILPGCKVTKDREAKAATPSNLNAATPTPTPAPTPGATLPSPTLAGEVALASGFDVNTSLQASWGTGQIPGSAAPDVLGAFRFICGAGQVRKDDPIMYPGQPGKSHLHQFYGNLAANANSTYSSLRASGDSTCNFVGNGAAANRSAYWMPALLNGKGYVVKPDFVAIYYKARPNTDPIVSDPSNPNFMGRAVQLPNGLRFIFGWDPTGVNSARTGSAYFNCQGPTAKPSHYPDLPTALANCPAGNQLGAVIEAPNCWDGKQLDSPDHRSHVAYMVTFNKDTLKEKAGCPLTHPYVIPQFTQGAWYTVGVGDDTRLWELSSDHMAPGYPKGHTFHADFFMAWDPTVHAMWWSNCINRMLNCSGGDLGNGKQLKGAQQPIYNGITMWKNPQRLALAP